MADRITPKDLERMLTRMASDIVATRVETTRTFAEVQQGRAERLAQVHERLKAERGVDDPQVKALETAAAAATSLFESLRIDATRQAKWPKIGPHEWMVFGQVRSKEGELVQGARVRVFDKDRRYDDLLGDTYTDELGDFAVVYHERDFAEIRENLPELYVLVEDDEGNQRYSSREHVRPQPGRAEYFDIMLSEKPPGSPKSGEEPGPPAAGKQGDNS